MIKNFQGVVFCLSRINKLLYTLPPLFDAFLNAEWREIFFPEDVENSGIYDNSANDLLLQRFDHP